MKQFPSRAFSIAACVGLLGSTVAFGEEISHIGTNQRTLVICVEYSDAATTRMPNCSDWVTVLSSHVNTFYNQATFNQTNFQFETVSGSGAPADGWFSLGHASTDYDFFKTGQKAIDLADPFVGFNLYNRIVVITNWPDYGAQGGNVWEQNEAIPDGLSRGLRGGDYVFVGLHLLAASRNSYFPSSEIHYVGFRVAEVP